MTLQIPMPDFDQLADIYWRLGGMQSPSQLHGYLVGQLAVGETREPEQWLEQAAAFIDAVEPPNAEDSQVLSALYGATQACLKGGEMELQLLLPDDGAEITQRVDSIGQWCQGFVAGFAQGGTAIKEQQGQQQYPKDVSEAVSDIAAISQIGLSDADTDLEQSEQNIVEISEYLRVAAMTIYLECNKPQEGDDNGPVSEVEAEAEVAGALSNLFNKTDKKLH
ncbi:UPF0149 family protein [Oceanicoccus sagamiensis]|uniref:YecA family protein n=1 Tax=Oceanicoccus sagamiensis TaxID=716816 RepID=A0A1X9NI83_9GAMM|nr:UPF0149 family protein [Oceanicoccus sagamiensis]ARN73693.1 hypothetical protein BST96_05925 [Oceanicoccus sagamiensis]